MAADPPEPPEPPEPPADNPGLATDLAILELGGSTIERHRGYRVVRTPANPLFHWGNFLIADADGPAALEDADGWLDVFARHFPGADYVAIALPRRPVGPAWAAAGVPIETDDILVADRPPEGAPLPTGFRVERLENDAPWEGARLVALADLEQRMPRDRQVNETFSRARVADKRRLAATGRAAYFAVLGADGNVAATLGIVCCGRYARFQDVVTAPDFRRRGLAAHLLGVAARWAGEKGCSAWVIVAAADGPAGRIYRRAGFVESARMVSAYRT